MQRLITSRNLMEVEIIKGILDEHGIAATIRNSFIAATQGLAGTFDWPELWVINDSDVPAAQAALEEAKRREPASLLREEPTI